MAGYSKCFLLDALCSRYESIFENDEGAKAYRDMCERHYDKVGKDAFRVSASLDAAEIKKFKLESGRKS